MPKPPSRLLATLLLAFPCVAVCQTAEPAAKEDSPQTLSPIVVTSERDQAGAIRLDQQAIRAQRANTSDTASLLEGIPGVSSYGAGGISSLPVIHGIADDRLRTLVDGMDLMTACPNHMNPALSFIDPSKVGSVDVFAGITPVSVGGDSIGGTIQVNSARPKFAKPDEGFLAEGELGMFQRSNGNARGKNLRVMAAGEYFNLSYAESESDSDNYWAAGDFKVKSPSAWKNLSGGRTVGEREVGASEYKGSQNRELGLALRPFRNHVVKFSVSEQRLDYEGFPNQRMDMISSVQDPSDPTGFTYVLQKGKPSNVNQLANFQYTGQFEWGEIEARYFHQKLQHHMDMLPERFMFMMMPMDTVARTDGGLLKVSIDLTDADILRVGYDFQNYRLDDWWPAIDNGGMGPNTFWNIRDGKRDRAYLFAEWDSRWSPAWMTLLGIRGGTVKSDAGLADGYNGSYSDDLAFNARDHFRKDTHLDWTALARYAPGATQTYEAGLARKTRSPNLYERYPWSYNSMAALMNNFVGDGNGYIGNPDLKPEIAHTLSASADWHDAAKEQWSFKLTAYLTYVSDFIDARRCTPSMSVQCPASNATSTNSYLKLQYVNQSARLYGFDISGKAELGRIDYIGNFALSGMISYVRGENRTTGDDLYHIMPLNLKLALVHRLAGWTNTLEAIAVEEKNRVSSVRNEVVTPEYTLLNLRTSYAWKHARLDVALENALDKFYLLPLGGAYVGQGNSMSINTIPWGMVVPGRGRSLNMALNVFF
ncbi:MAG: TonB-dependent receptor [Pseudomonadota bacterium]